MDYGSSVSKYGIENRMKPKAAIILSGRVSGWLQCLRDFEAAFSLYDYDIYCSLNCKEDDQDFLQFSQYKHVKKIQAVLSKEIIDYSKFHLTEDHHRANMLSMFLHNKLAFELIDQEYDIYIRARIDFLSASVRNVHIQNTIIPMFSKDELNKLWIPHCHKYGVYKFQMNDQFALSNYENMKKYCSAIDHLERYKKLSTLPFCPETMLAFHVAEQNLELDEFAFEYFLSARRHRVTSIDRDNDIWRFVHEISKNMGIQV